MKSESFPYGVGFLSKILMKMAPSTVNSINLNIQKQIEKGLNMITEKGKKKIGVLGFSFKAGTDDHRESPMVEVIERLLGKGYDVKIYDKNVNLASLVGANKTFIMDQIPHISALMCKSKEQVLDHAEVVIIGNAAEEFEDVIDQISSNQILVDLVRISGEVPDDTSYDGICW